MNASLFWTGAASAVVGACALVFRTKLTPHVEAAPVAVSAGPVLPRIASDMRAARRLFFVVSAVGLLVIGLVVCWAGLFLP